MLSEFVRIRDSRDGACAVDETLWILRWPGDIGDDVSDDRRPTSMLLRRAGDGSFDGKSTVIFDLITCGVDSWTDVSVSDGEGDRMICWTGVMTARFSVALGRSAGFTCGCEMGTCFAATVGAFWTISIGAVGAAFALGVSNIWAGLSRAATGRTAWGIAKGESSGEATCVRAVAAL